MINYIDINAVLPSIAKTVREEDSIPNLLSYILEGYRLLDSPAHTEETVVVLEVKDHKTSLPSGIKKINFATYMSSNPTEEDESTITDVQSVTIDLATSTGSTECVGNYILSHRLFLLSNYFNNNFSRMKYVGTSEFVCTDCINRFCHDCSETFSVDKNRILNTSFKDGFVCLSYETEVKRDGKFQIVDHPDIRYYLARFAELEHFRNRAYSQETNAINLMDRLEGKVSLWYAKANSALTKKLLNKSLIAELTTNRFNARFLFDGAYAYRANNE